MTDRPTLLMLAARCRRMAGLCSTEAIARKFQALALDYEEHARVAARRQVIVELQRDTKPGAADPENPEGESRSVA